jgi:hypothetical protein
MAFDDRELRIVRPSVVGDHTVKWYHITAGRTPIERSIHEAAQAYVPYLLAPADGTPPAAFAIVHRAADSVYLMAYTWVWDNVVHCRSASAGSEFLGSVPGRLTEFYDLRNPAWMGCVWELPVVAHERGAWVRHMLMPDQPDLDAYLGDVLTAGRVGAPTR